MDNTSDMVALCSWCHDSAERTLALQRDGIMVTHTICPAHAAEFERGAPHRPDAGRCPDCGAWPEQGCVCE